MVWQDIGVLRRCVMTRANRCCSWVSRKPDGRRTSKGHLLGLGLVAHRWHRRRILCHLEDCLLWAQIWLRLTLVQLRDPVRASLWLHWAGLQRQVQRSTGGSSIKVWHLMLLRRPSVRWVAIGTPVVVIFIVVASVVEIPSFVVAFIAVASSLGRWRSLLLGVRSRGRRPVTV